MNNNRGFTLVETLLVLLITSLSMLAGIVLLFPTLNHIEDDLFINQFKADIHFFQSYALAENQSVYLQFYPQSGKYQASINHQMILTKRSFPLGTSIVQSNFQMLTIYPNGSIQPFGTLYFKMHGTLKKVTFYIGQGRFDVQE
jgi:competence protein ComGD